MNGQNKHNRQQRQHHNLRHTFQSVLQSECDNGKTEHDDNDHSRHQLLRAGQHTAELFGNSLCVQTVKSSGCRLRKVKDHPSGYGGVIHHQQIVPCQAHIAMQMPFTVFRLQFIIHFHRAGLCRAAHGKFHGHGRNAQNNQAYQVNQYECASSVLPGQPWKLPYVADADRASCTQQDKPKTAPKMFSFHFKVLSILSRLLLICLQPDKPCFSVLPSALPAAFPVLQPRPVPFPVLPRPAAPLIFHGCFTSLYSVFFWV